MEVPKEILPYIAMLLIGTTAGGGSGLLFSSSEVQAHDHNIVHPVTKADLNGLRTDMMRDLREVQYEVQTDMVKMALDRMESTGVDTQSREYQMKVFELQQLMEKLGGL